MKTLFETETHDRLVRIESRLCTLGEHVGANLGLRRKVLVSREGAGDRVDIDSLDTTLSRIRTELCKAGVISPNPVPVYFDRKLVAMLTP